MQNKARIYKILIIFLGFLIVSSLIVSYFFLFSNAKNKNLNYIPENAIVKARINGKVLIGKSIENICFENPDSKLLTQLDTLIQQTLRTDIKNTGIDYLSEIGAFVIEINGTYNYFLLLNIDDKNEFNSYFSNTTSYKYALSKDGEVGIVQLNFDSFSKLKNDYLKTILNKESSFKFKENDFKNDITIESKGFSSFSKNDNFKLNCNFFGDRISMNGKFNNQINSTEEKFSLIKNGLHFSINEPTILNRISELIKNYNPSFPELNHLEMNYRGMSLTEGGNPYFAEPDFDLLISCKNKINPDSILNFVNKYNDFGISYKNNKLLMGKSLYNLNVYDNKHLFITKKKSSIAQKTNNNLFEINGSPDLLTKIKAPEYITSFFEMMTPYAASKSYLSSIDDFNLAIKKGSFKSEIVFKKNKNSFQELLKTFLIVKGIQ